MSSFKQQQTLLIVGTIAIISMLGTGCASVTRGTKRDLPVDSKPQGLSVTAKDARTGKIIVQAVTPTSIRLSTRQHADGVVVTALDTFGNSESVHVGWKTSTWGGIAQYGGDTILCITTGIVGAGAYVVDGITKASKDTAVEAIHFDFTKYGLAQPPPAPLRPAVQVPMAQPQPAPCPPAPKWPKGWVIIRSL